MKDPKEEIIERVCKLRHGGMDDKQFKAAVEHLLTPVCAPQDTLGKIVTQYKDEPPVVTEYEKETLGWEAEFDKEFASYFHLRNWDGKGESSAQMDVKDFIRRVRDEALAEGRNECRCPNSNNPDKSKNCDCTPGDTICFCGQRCLCHQGDKPKLPEKVELVFELTGNGAVDANMELLRCALNEINDYLDARDQLQ